MRWAGGRGDAEMMSLLWHSNNSIITGCVVLCPPHCTVDWTSRRLRATAEIDERVCVMVFACVVPVN